MALAVRVIILLRGLARGAPHSLLTIAMLVASTILHYANLPVYESGSPVYLAEHGMDRVLLIVPVVYAGFIFGPRGGFVTLVAATTIMLPRALFLSPNPADAVLECASVVLVSSLIILWFGGQEKEKARRLEVLTRLEVARQELASQVEIIMKDERRLAALNEVCGVVAQSLDLPQILQRILDKVVEEMGVAVALIFLKDKSGHELELVAHTGVSTRFAAAVAALQVGDGFNGRVVESGEPMVVENALDDACLCVEEVRKEGLQAQLIVPMRSKGTTIGTLCVGARSSRRFSEDDLELLNAIGSQVGIAIENARLYQEALTSEEKYRDLFENATVAIFVHDLDGLITDANKACTNLSGYALADLIGLELAKLFPTTAYDCLSSIQRRLLQGEAIEQPYDVPFVRRDGAEAILSLSTRLVAEDGQPLGFQQIARDVTERRRMRDSLNYYVRQILTAQEEERKRIARELHDETAQSLLLILQRLDGLTSDQGRSISARAKRELEDLRGVVLRTLGDLRRLTHDLRPQILDDLGLVAAVEWLADDMERQHGIRTLVEVVGLQPAIRPENQLLLFRIAQEALSNVRRHAAATTARVLLDFLVGTARLVVEDDGQGFEMPGSMSDLANAGKLGLVGMSERARLAGGSITIESRPGRGTRVVAELAAN